MRFEAILIMAYIIFGLVYANWHISRYAKVAKQRREIMKAREGLKSEIDVWLFYLSTVVFWPLVIGRHKEN